MKSTHSPLLALFMVALLCGCNPGTSISTDDGKISAKGDGVTLHASGLPNAKISASGDLEINGKNVEVNAAQRALLQSYHHEINAMTADGIAIGKQGAALAGKAVTEVIKGAISGNADNVESRVEAEAKKIEQRAMQLCKRLVKVKASQDALAASLPEFRPYATMDQSDVDGCGTDRGNSHDAGKEAGGALARKTKDGNDQVTGTDAAQPADAAGAEVEATSDESSNSR